MEKRAEESLAMVPSTRNDVELFSRLGKKNNGKVGWVRAIGDKIGAFSYALVIMGCNLIQTARFFSAERFIPDWSIASSIPTKAVEYDFVMLSLCSNPGKL